MRTVDLTLRVRHFFSGIASQSGLEYVQPLRGERTAHDSRSEGAMPETTLQPESIPLNQARIAQGLTIESARDLLDWLEAHGIEKADIEFDETEHATVLLR